MRSNLSTTIPFDGFYESFWSQEIDSIEEREAEYFEERQREEGIPKDLRLDASDFADILWRVTNYRIIHEAAAKTIAGSWNELASEELGFDLGLTFEEITSPKYYNFETDRLFMSMPRNTLAKLFRMSRAEKHERLRKSIKDRFTSRDGFISHYSNDIDDWLAKPLSSWDHNEIGTLLVTLTSEIDNYDLYNHVCDCDGLYNEWNEGVDWQSFEEHAKEKRDEKLAHILELDPDFVIPEPRCPLTMEMKF
jgi:hypothetical protein